MHVTNQFQLESIDELNSLPKERCPNLCFLFFFPFFFCVCVGVAFKKIKKINVKINYFTPSSKLLSALVGQVSETHVPYKLPTSLTCA
jgi:hypothetical protein